MLEVVDPAVRDALVVGPVDLRRQRAVPGPVDVLARGGRTHLVVDLVAGLDVLVAHVRLHLAELARRRRLHGVDRAAGVGRRRGGREHEGADAHDDGDDRDREDRRAEPLERRTAPRSAGAARRGGRRARCPWGWSTNGPGGWREDDPGRSPFGAGCLLDWVKVAAPCVARRRPGRFDRRRALAPMARSAKGSVPCGCAPESRRAPPTRRARVTRPAMAAGARVAGDGVRAGRARRGPRAGSARRTGRRRAGRRASANSGCAARRASGTAGTVSVDSPSASVRDASLRWITSVVVKIVYASSTMTTTPMGETGALIAWSTTQRSETPDEPEDQERVAEEDPDAGRHRAQLGEHRADDATGSSRGGPDGRHSRRGAPRRTR